MANIELVIKIDEEQYEFIKRNMTMHEVKNYHAFLYDICGCIKNGTPLPKGHGRLGDADNIIPLALKKKTLVLKDTDLIDIRSREFVIDYLFKDIKDYINNMPTIIEADKERE